MMKKVVFILSIISIFFFAGCTNFMASDMEVVEYTPDENELHFFQAGRRIIGIGSVDFDVKVNIKFNSFVVFGEKANENILIADDGKKVGAAGKEMYVVKNKKIVKRFPVFPNTQAVKLIGDKIFVSNGAYTSDGLTGLQIFDAQNFKILYETQNVGNIVSKRNIQKFGNYVFIAVPASGQFNRKSYVMKINLKTLQREDIYLYTENHPFDQYDILIDGYRLMVVFNESREIAVYTLFDDRLVKTIDVKSLTHIPTGEAALNYWLVEPVLVGGDLAVILTDNLPGVLFQKLIFFDRTSYAFKGELNLEPLQNLGFYNLRYVNGSRMWFENGDYICVYDSQNGQLLKEIHVGKFTY